MRPACSLVNVASDTSADGPTLSQLWVSSATVGEASRPLWAARIDVTVNDGGRVGAATTNGDVVGGALLIGASGLSARSRP